MTVERPVTEEEIRDPTAVPEVAPAPKIPLYERSVPMFGAFLLIAAGVLIVALLTVHKRQPDELVKGPGSQRSYIVLANWLKDGYFRYCGLINRNPTEESIYRNSTGAYMVSGFVVEKLYSAASGKYSYRLLALHNQFVMMIVAALAGLLSYRLARRFGLDPLLAFAAGACVTIILFTFPDNLDVYWEMSAQLYALLFALLFLVIEERSVVWAERPRAVLLAQGATVFVMTEMESIVAIGFIVSLAATLALLRRNEPRQLESWKRFVVVVVAPFLAAFILYQLQLIAGTARLPDAPVSGSEALWRTGLDGEATFYGDHLGIATRRDTARHAWPQTGQYLFRWKWVFLLGVTSLLGVVIAFLRGRAPRIALEVLAALTGSWLLYAAVFSQALVIHPYLYDVLLFTPLCIALFALAPSLLESMTGRTGAVLLLIVFSTLWYSFFQLRLYALRRPMPPRVESPATKG